MPPALELNWAELIGQIAGPMKTTDTRESWLARAARKSKLSCRQIKSLYYGTSKDPRTSTTIAVLTAAEKARKEACQLASQFESLAGSLNAKKNPDRHSTDVFALINAARALRGVVGP